MTSDSTATTVRRLRLAHGLDQQTLAESAGLSSGTLSMIENSRVNPTETQLAGLAEKLGCSVEFLQAKRPEVRTTRPWLRAYADASKKDLDRVVADSELAIDAFTQMGLRRIPDNIPTFDGDLDDDESIEAFATDVRTATRLGTGDVVPNAVRAAERLGAVVLPMDSELGRHLGLSVRIDGVPVLRTARAGAVPGDRQRFTVAHELGHLALHHATPPPTSPSEASRIERQAHRFAGAFLTPADAVVEDLQLLGGRVTISTLIQLKARWGFSVKAFVTRFRQLGVIDSDQARSLYKQMSARKMNRREPGLVENESARWPIAALREAAIDDPGRQVGLEPTFFQRWVSWSEVSKADVVDLRARRESRTGSR